MFMIKQPANTTGYDIHPTCKYASILKTGMKNKDKRLFLESVLSFLDKNSVNKRAHFPKVCASLFLYCLQSILSQNMVILRLSLRLTYEDSAFFPNSSLCWFSRLLDD